MPATKPQHLRALDDANRIRIAQAALFRLIRSADRPTGAALAAQTLRDATGVAGTIKLDRLLRSVRRLGNAMAPRVLSDAGIPPARLTRRLSELTEREREAIASALVKRCGVPDERPTASAGSPDIPLARRESELERAVA